MKLTFITTILGLTTAITALPQPDKVNDAQDSPGCMTLAPGSTVGVTDARGLPPSCQTHTSWSWNSTHHHPTHSHNSTHPHHTHHPHTTHSRNSTAPHHTHSHTTHHPHQPHSSSSSITSISPTITTSTPATSMGTAPAHNKRGTRPCITIGGPEATPGFPYEDSWPPVCEPWTTRPIEQPTSTVNGTATTFATVIG